MTIRFVRKDLPTAFRWLFTLAPVVAGGVRMKPTGFGRILADRWGTLSPLGPGGLWIDAQDTQHLPLGMRVRAATALEPVRW